MTPSPIPQDDELLKLCDAMIGGHPIPSEYARKVARALKSRLEAKSLLSPASLGVEGATVNGPYDYDHDIHPSYRVETATELVACVYAADGDLDKADARAQAFAKLLSPATGGGQDQDTASWPKEVEKIARHRDGWRSVVLDVAGYLGFREPLEQADYDEAEQCSEGLSENFKMAIDELRTASPVRAEPTRVELTNAVEAAEAKFYADRDNPQIGIVPSRSTYVVNAILEAMRPSKPTAPHTPTATTPGEPFHRDYPSQPPWKEGERSRMVGDTKVYRSYADYVDD